MNSMAPWWMWAGFIIFILFMLLIDLGMFRKASANVSLKRSLAWVGFWVILALCFNAFLFWYSTDKQKALEFFTGYLIEKALSVDNLFVFLMIFNFLQVPAILQRRVLMYGVLGALILRALMIGIGSYLVIKIHWILYVFGAFLVFTGIKMLIFANKENKSLDENMLLKFLRNHLPVLPFFQGEKFFVRQNKKLFVTPLFIALLLIEFSDIIFATDSVPAIFAITQDPFIVFSSNIFAIMGLRSLYFVLARMAERFHLLKFAVALILLLIGAKMLIEPWLNIPTLAALALVVIILGLSIAASLISRRHSDH